MRALVVMGAGIGALALWVWFTGPGTSLPLALGGGLCAILASRIAYRLLTPREADGDTAPSPDNRGEP